MAKDASSPPFFVPPNAPGQGNPRLPAPPVARDPRQLAQDRILLRGDSHYCCPEVLDFCRANGLDFILGVAPTTTLRRHVGDLEASTKARFDAAPKDGKVRRFKEFFDGAASWSRVERIIARVEVGADGPDTRFIVTNLKGAQSPVLYEDVYCRRGQAENHIKSWKTHLAADRTSCTKATANQFRLFLHAGAYWINGLRPRWQALFFWNFDEFGRLRSYVDGPDGKHYFCTLNDLVGCGHMWTAPMASTIFFAL